MILAFLRKDWPLVAGGLALAAIVIGVILFARHVTSLESTVEAQDRQIEAQAANIRTLEADAKAREQAAQERAADTASIETAKDEVIHEIRKAPDSSPAAARTAINCLRLKRAGYREAALPAACRSGGGK